MTFGRLPVVWLAVLAGPVAASAQIVSGVVGLARATERELSTPSSYSWTIQSLPIAGFSLYAGRSWLTGAPHHPYTTCDSYWPSYEHCLDEKVDGRFTLHAAWYGLAYRYELRSWFLEAGRRRASYRIDGRLVGVESRRQVEMILPGGGIGGWGVDVTAGRKLERLGLTLIARYSRDRIDLHFGVDDAFAPIGQPFATQSVSLGLEWSPLRR